MIAPSGYKIGPTDLEQGLEIEKKVTVKIRRNPSRHQTDQV